MNIFKQKGTPCWSKEASVSDYRPLNLFLLVPEWSMDFFCKGNKNENTLWTVSFAVKWFGNVWLFPGQ